MRQLGEVEAWQQLENFSCGAATLKAVLRHWGLDIDEPTLSDLIGIDPKTGSTAEQVEVAAKKLNFQAKTFVFDNVDELAPFTASGVPVIMAIQSFRKPDQGHFVVGTKVDGNTVRIMDPNVKGNWRTLSKNETARRWKFRDNVGIVVTPKTGLNGSDTAQRRRFYDYGRGLDVDESWAAGWWIVGGIAATLGVVWWLGRTK